MQITKAIFESRLIDAICSIIGLCLLFSAAFLAIIMVAILGLGVWYLIQEIVFDWFT